MINGAVLSEPAVVAATSPLTQTRGGGGSVSLDLGIAFATGGAQMDVRVCISLTDQFVHERIINERYQAAVMELEQHINESGNLDPSGIGSVVTLKDDTKIHATKSSCIAYEDEPRLMLLREWSLLDSKELHVDASTSDTKLLEHIYSPENSLDIPWEFMEANMKKVLHSCSSRSLFFGVDVNFMS
ncbi:hypothetical protein GUJ93_ZPchr0005g15419 [Zizania palustris]|uniref:Uncharacterized protein n=1 Tax=Zizania palustris TaxID=103762 RepID=A0A8J5W0X9_ZIZPA|nr:hypothetical protein GUJ93_ZPchr0005g15419 [Zizania palustris]